LLASPAQLHSPAARTAKAFQDDQLLSAVDLCFSTVDDAKAIALIAPPDRRRIARPSARSARSAPIQRRC